MNGKKIAGITANGSHDLWPPAAAIGMPGAVDTSSGGPSSATGTGGVTLASCGTGTTDCSVGVPRARGVSGRTGLHITIVVERAGAAWVRFGTARLTRRTNGRRGFTATFFGTGLGTTVAAGAAALAGVARLRCLTTGAFFTGAATGEHSTRESTDWPFRATGRCTERGVVSRFTTWPPAGCAAERPATTNVANVPIVRKECFICIRLAEKERRVSRSHAPAQEDKQTLQEN
jgi:hypothetical protein